MTRVSTLLALLIALALAPACEAPEDANGFIGSDATADAAGEGQGDTGPSSDAEDHDVQVPVEYDDPYDGEVGGALAAFDPGATDYFDFPFPSDLRLDGGKVDLTGFPNPFGVPLLDQYVSYGEAVLRGFSANGVAYFRFDRPLDSSLFPDATKSRSDASNVWILDADVASPAFGTRHAAEVTWFAGPGTAYLPDNVLMVRPVPGQPLREGRTYAVVVRRSQLDADGAVLAVPEPLRQVLAGEATDPALAGAFEPLVALADAGHLNPFEVGVATVFTVDRYTDELVRIREHIVGAPAPKITDWKLLDSKKGYALYEGTYVAPNFQHGEKPYAETGGGIVFDDNGAPVVAEMETIRVALAVPEGSPPFGAWPVALYGHGTGGNYLSFANASGYKPGKLLTDRNVAVLSIDQPLHGVRWTGGGDVSLLSFNYLNPEAGRSNFRQSAIDFLTLTRVVREGVVLPGSVAVTGEDTALDADRITYVGHSHGGLGGVMVAAVEPDVRAYVISGAGAGLAQTVVLRKEPVDIHELLSLILQEKQEVLSFQHPVINLVQTLVDVTDPMNYAPYLLSGELREGKAISVLVTEGLEDPITPPITTESLAAAAGLPVVAPALQLSPGMQAAGAGELSLPISANFKLGGVHPSTAALFQEGGFDHFLIFDSAKGSKLYADFIQSAIYSFATLE
jgi:pimeloyl-ACP methyl ester carboxylesterase